MAYDITESATDIGTMDRSWGVVAAAAVGLTFSIGTLLLYTFGVFVRPLTTEFGWSRTQLSGALAVSQYTFALSAPAWGLLIDRFGPRAVTLPSVVCISALVGSLSLLESLWQYCLTFAAVSFCAGEASPIGYSAVLVRKFERHLGLALGRALPGAATVLPLIRSRAFIVMCIIFLLLGTVLVGTLTSIVPIMVGRGFTPQEAAQIAGLTGLTAILGRGGIGWVLDRVHPPYVAAAMALLALCAFLLVAYGTGTASAYLIAALLGGVVGVEVDFTAFFIRRYFGNAMFGRLHGLAFGIFLVGSGSGPVLASAGFNYFGSYRPGALPFAAGSLVVVLLTFAMPPLRPSPRLAAA